MYFRYVYLVLYMSVQNDFICINYHVNLYLIEIDNVTMNANLIISQLFTY